MTTPEAANDQTTPPPAVGLYETQQERLQRTRRISWRRWLAAYTYDVLALLKEARFALIGLTGVMAVGTMYFVVFHPREAGTAAFDIFSAMYETMSMMLFEQNVDFPDDLLGRVLFFAIPLLGIAFVFQGVLDFGRLIMNKGERLEGWQVSQARTYRDHVIVCGLGRVSYRIVLQLLESDYDVVVIEANWEDEFIGEMLQLAVPVIHGDARDSIILKQAGVDRARALMAGINNDLLNIEIGLAARRIRPDLHVVLRIFHEQLDRNLESSTFGANTAFSSSALSAPTLAAACVCRGITGVLPLPEFVLGIAELRVEAGSRLDDMISRIEEAFGVQVICYTGGTTPRNVVWRYRIAPDTRLYPGDRIKVIGTLPALSAMWEHGYDSNRIAGLFGFKPAVQPTQQNDTVIVCGLGRVGYRVVRALHAMEPRPDIVVVCDQNTELRFVEDVQRLGIRVVKGDARTAHVLEDAGVDHAYAIAAMTSDDLNNLRICLTAHQARRDIHMVMRVFSDALADQLDDMFGQHVSYSTAALAAPTMASATILQGTTSYAIEVGGRLLSTARLLVRSNGFFVGKSIQRLREEKGIVVVLIRRDGQTLLMPCHPDKPHTRYSEPLRAGDEIVVLGDVTQISNLVQQGDAVAGVGDRSMTSNTPTHTPQPVETLPPLAILGHGNGKRNGAPAAPPPPRRANITQPLPPLPPLVDEADEADETDENGTRPSPHDDTTRRALERMMRYALDEEQDDPPPPSARATRRLDEQEPF